MAVPPDELARFRRAEMGEACRLCRRASGDVRLMDQGEPYHIACLQRLVGAEVAAIAPRIEDDEE